VNTYGNYAYNSNLEGYKETWKKKLAVMADAAENTATKGEARYYFSRYHDSDLTYIRYLHTGGTDILFNDGHVEWIKQGAYDRDWGRVPRGLWSW